MFVIVVVVFVASQAGAHEQALSTSPPPPFMDLFTAVGNHYYPENRKTYSDSHYVSCPQPDSLGSIASILGSAAKIVFSVAAIAFLKIIGGKMMLFPLTFILLAKMGLKAVLLWPMISKMVKYFKKKKKKDHKGRSAVDCSDRIACVMHRAARDGWGSHLGAATAFTLIDDVHEDSSYAKILLTILAGDKVAKCMSVECTSGVDVS
ncbi:uncharacterized protein LOC126368981 [Pectinophora gossypiella]|uniref:uncharacterized protein LOC126368981 n=1 Tax=Pectinophora gossypiella TaxID=13191 RepID=UPI00214E9D5E|nr:uncharacterized protein LOC126368981 [Pectinophora gossypiella]